MVDLSYQFGSFYVEVQGNGIEENVLEKVSSKKIFFFLIIFLYLIFYILGYAGVQKPEAMREKSGELQ